MGYAILRTQKLKSPVAVRRSMKHAFREQETPNADPQRVTENTHIGANSVAEGIAAFNAALPAKFRKDAVLAIEYLVTASPEDMHGKSRQEQDAYFRDALEWLRSKHGSDQVVYAGIHRDETTPHMYAYVVPVDPDTGRLNAKKWLGGAKALNEMQTDFAHQVGRVHGLQRGIEGSKARHTTVREFYAAIKGQDHGHSEISADQVKPAVLKKGFLTSLLETPEQTAERLTDQVKKSYEPVVRNASVARLERRRAAEMESTAKAKDKSLKDAQARLKGFEGMFEGLSEADMRAIAASAAKFKAERKIEAEKKRRVDALPELLKRVAGAASTFAEKALAAIKEKAGDWVQVNWEAVEQASVREAVQQHNQPMRKAVEAILRYSPAQADKTPEQVKIILDHVETKQPKLKLNRPERPDPDRGFSR